MVDADHLRIGGTGEGDGKGLRTYSSSFGFFPTLRRHRSSSATSITSSLGLTIGLSSPEAVGGRHSTSTSPNRGNMVGRSHRAQFSGCRGRPPQHFNQPKQRQHGGENAQPAKMDQRQRVEKKHVEAAPKDQVATAEKFPQIACFNCGESGHYSSGCNKPRICFICLEKDHVSDNCPEWKTITGSSVPR